MPAQLERPERSESETTQWLQSLLLFAITWSFGGTLDGESRIKYDFMISYCISKVHGELLYRRRCQQYCSQLILLKTYDFVLVR